MHTKPYILFVDDSLDDVIIACWYLSKQGLQVDHAIASTEDQLRAQLSQQQPSLILSDLLMPNFDGWSALRVSQRLVPAVPFIFYSGYISADTRRGAADQNAFGCIEKNSGTEAFAVLVRTALTHANSRVATPC